MLLCGCLHTPNFFFVANPEPILVCVAGCYHDVIRELPSLVETCGILIDLDFTLIYRSI